MNTTVTPTSAPASVTPPRYRADDANTTEIHFAIGECFLGSVLVARSAQGICAILLDDNPDMLARDLKKHFPRTNLTCDATLEQLVAEVVNFIEVPEKGLELPLDIRGTAFQQRVWQALQEIPVGSVASYADIATRIGVPKAARAVAQACATNVLAVAIPCHRVVAKSGGLAGYRWGVERKRALLEREHSLDLGCLES